MSQRPFERSLWEHLKNHHYKALKQVAQKYRLFEPRHGVSEEALKKEVALTLYNGALAEKERSSVPALGHSTDI